MGQEESLKAGPTSPNHDVSASAETSAAMLTVGKLTAGVAVSRVAGGTSNEQC